MDYMNARIERLGVAGLAYICFGIISTYLYMKYIHDVGGALWSIGIFGLPAVLLLVWWLDKWLDQRSWLNKRKTLLAIIDVIAAILLYLPGYYLVLMLFYVFSGAFW